MEAWLNYYFNLNNHEHTHMHIEREREYTYSRKVKLEPTSGWIPYFKECCNNLRFLVFHLNQVEMFKFRVLYEIRNFSQIPNLQAKNKMLGEAEASSLFVRSQGKFKKIKTNTFTSIRICIRGGGPMNANMSIYAHDESPKEIEKGRWIDHIYTQNNTYNCLTLPYNDYYYLAK